MKNIFKNRIGVIFILLFSTVYFPLAAQLKFPVYTIQGTGDASNHVGKKIITEGVVIGDFQEDNQLSGFYIQDTVGDDNEKSSDGIFVYSDLVNINLGDYITVQGTVAELKGLTEINNVSALKILGTGYSVAAVKISLPKKSEKGFEKYEGMLVEFDQTLTVTDNYDLGMYGELILSSQGRLFSPTNYIDPNDDPANGNNSIGSGNVLAILKEEVNNINRSIILDDGSNTQYPDKLPYVDSKEKTIRADSTVTGLIGIMDNSFGAYRIHPTMFPLFNYSPRPAVPVVADANLKIASLNLYNFFNGDGKAGGFPTSRGADSFAEYSRQLAKIASAINSLNADIVCIMEMENDGDQTYSAIASLVNALNVDRNADDLYTYILDPKGKNGNSGTDAIKVGMLYKPSVVLPLGSSYADTNAVFSRPPMAQTFSLISTGEKFSMIANHFKSKGCSGATGTNKDNNDGQSCFNEKRKLESKQLLKFIETIQSVSGDEDVIILGDLNAYNEEDPIDILSAGGLDNLIVNSYSYNFNGEAGALDHAFCTQSLADKNTTAEKWHINADEPQVLDYNMEHKQDSVYTAGPQRYSDHDPIMLGFKLNGTSLGISDKYQTNFIIFSPFPNPFSGSTNFTYTLKKEMHVELKLYNIQGMEINDLINEKQTGGKHSCEWQGTTANGLPVNKGICFFKFFLTDEEGANFIRTGKINFE